MNTINSRIIYLWQQFSARQATRAELDELMELLSSGSHDEESRQYLQHLLAATPAGEEDPARWEPILQSILHPVRTLEPYAEASDPQAVGAARPSRVRRMVRRVMTAAAVILALAGLFRLWRTYRAEGSPVQTPVALWWRLGATGPYSTLAGGQKIILDSAAGPASWRNRGVRSVKKVGDGKLAYEAGGGATKGVWRDRTIK